MVTNHLGNTVINKILNHKETVNSIFIDKEASFRLDRGTYEPERSQCYDMEYRLIIIIDKLAIIHKQ